MLALVAKLIPPQYRLAAALVVVGLVLGTIGGMAWRLSITEGQRDLAETQVAAQAKRIATLNAYAEQRDAAIAECAGLNDGLAAQVGELNRLNADLARANRDFEARARQRAADLDTRVAEDRRAAAARRAGAEAPPAEEMRAALARALGAGP